MSSNNFTVTLQDYNQHIRISPVNLSNILDHVPAKVYNVTVDPQNGDIILVKDRKKFDVKKKIFGKAKDYEKRLINDFKETEKSLGAILSGPKGSGKSMMTERVANYFIQIGMPVLYIDQKLPVNLLKAAIKIASPCVVIFDEFEKNYSHFGSDEGHISHGDQDGMLNFFSDSSYNKVLFMITVNDIRNLSEYFIDRPGRFKYHFKFNNLSATAVTEISDDYKLNKWQTSILGKLAYRVSYDALLVIAKVLKKSKTLLDFNREISVLNALGPHVLTISQIDFNHSDPVSFDDKVFSGIIDKRKTKDGTKIIISFHGLNNELVYREEINVVDIVKHFHETGELDYETKIGGNKTTIRCVIIDASNEFFDDIPSHSKDNETHSMLAVIVPWLASEFPRESYFNGFHKPMHKMKDAVEGRDVDGEEFNVLDIIEQSSISPNSRWPSPEHRVRSENHDIGF